LSKDITGLPISNSSRCGCRGHDYSGPVVITVAFIGYLAAGVAGAYAAAFVTFLHVYPG
jgi:hypothetical protein